MTINEAFQFVSFISNKTQSGTLQPNRFNTAAPRAQMQFYQKEYAIWDSTQIVTDNLKPFLVPLVLNVPTNGRATLPTDYSHIASARANYFVNNVNTEIPIKEVRNADWENYTSSQIVNPTKRYPIMTFYDTYVKFLPKNIGGINFDYLRLPVPCNWDYNIVGGRAVYNATSNPGQTGKVSQDFQFPDTAGNEICFIICTYLGINLNFGQLVQFSEQMKSEQQ